MIKVQTLKGFRDFLPKDVKKREYIINTLKAVFESYGFEPLETPSLEYEEILAGKYGEEGDKLMYKFEDNGQRKVALRYDQTVPLARVVAQYQNDLPIPFKRYQIQNVWRAENTQKGRYREFLQVDADIVGSYSLLSDAEIISLCLRSLEKLGFKDFRLWLNDRAVFNGIANEKIREVDKINKERDDKKRDQLIKDFLNTNPGMAKVINAEEPSSVKEVSLILEKMNTTSNSNVKFMQTLARGLDYYTGIIFEVEIKNYEGGSIAGGGRYDELIGKFAGKPIPAVGFSFGFDRLFEAMTELNLFPAGLDVTKVLVTNTNEKKALKIASELRKNGINTEIYLDEKDLEKQLKYADKKSIPFSVIFEGETLILKDMIRRTQEALTLEEIIKKLINS